MKRKKGFTLVEIMIVVVVIGLLASMGTLAVIKAIENSRIKTTKSELEIISTAVLQLAWDTGRWPNGGMRTEDFSSSSKQDELWDLKDSALMSEPSNLADYPGWQGPYYEGETEDLWGNDYFFDASYDCEGNGSADRVVVGSFGPSGTGQTDYDENNIWVAVDSLMPQSSED